MSSPVRHYSAKEIYSYLSGGFSDDDASAFERHMDTCPRCKEQAQCEFRALNEPWFPPSKARSTAVVTPIVPSAGQPAPARRLRMFPMALATAAVVLLGLGYVLWIVTHPNVDLREPVRISLA